MENKYKNKESDKKLWTNEPTIAYQRASADKGITRMMTQKELDKECFTIEESKNRVLDKINHHFHSL